MLQLQKTTYNLPKEVIDYSIKIILATREKLDNRWYSPVLVELFNETCQELILAGEEAYLRPTKESIQHFYLWLNNLEHLLFSNYDPITKEKGGN